MRRLTLIALLLTLSVSIYGQDAAPFTLTQACAPPESEAGRADFPGVLLGYAVADGVRAYRAEVGVSYYVAFAGSAFIDGGAVSPDGKYYAVPYGLVQMPTGTDRRYHAFELRIMGTDRLTQLRRVIAWSAYFQVGGPGDIQPLRWLDASTLVYPQGDVRGSLAMQTVTPFTETVGITPAPDLDGYEAFSPDFTRAIGPDADGTALYDLRTGQVLRRVDALRRITFAPGTGFAAVDLIDGRNRALRVYDADGAPLETLLRFDADTLVYNLSFSPDGARLAFTRYDPQPHENRLVLADLESRTLLDTCLLLDPQHKGGPRGGALAWSPEGGALAVVVADSALGLPTQVLTLADEGFGFRGRYGLTGDIGALLGWYTG